MIFNEKALLIKEFDVNDNFPEIFDLSKDFFYEYAKNNEDFFGIDCLNEVDIKNILISLLVMIIIKHILQNMIIK